MARNRFGKVKDWERVAARLAKKDRERRRETERIRAMVLKREIRLLPAREA